MINNSQNLPIEGYSKERVLDSKKILHASVTQEFVSTRSRSNTFVQDFISTRSRSNTFVQEFVSTRSRSNTLISKENIAQTFVSLPPSQKGLMEASASNVKGVFRGVSAIASSSFKGILNRTTDRKEYSSITSDSLTSKTFVQEENTFTKKAKFSESPSKTRPKRLGNSLERGLARARRNARGEKEFSEKTTLPFTFSELATQSLWDKIETTQNYEDLSELSQTLLLMSKRAFTFNEQDTSDTALKIELLIKAITSKYSKLERTFPKNENNRVLLGILFQSLYEAHEIAYLMKTGQTPNQKEEFCLLEDALPLKIKKDKATKNLADQIENAASIKELYTHSKKLKKLTKKVNREQDYTIKFHRLKDNYSLALILEKKISYFEINNSKDLRRVDRIKNLVEDIKLNLPN